MSKWKYKLQHCQPVKIGTKTSSGTFYLSNVLPPTIVPDVFLHVTCTVGPDTTPTYTDPRMDWGDACSLGRNGEQYFLLQVDKNTE